MQKYCKILVKLSFAANNALLPAVNFLFPCHGSMTESTAPCQSSNCTKKRPNSQHKEKTPLPLTTGMASTHMPLLYGDDVFPPAPLDCEFIALFF